MAPSKQPLRKRDPSDVKVNVGWLHDLANQSRCSRIPEFGTGKPLGSRQDTRAIRTEGLVVDASPGYDGMTPPYAHGLP